MVQLRPRPDSRGRRIEPLDARRKRQAEEGAQALKDYRIAQQKAFERMIASRRERFAQLSKAQS